MKSNFYHIQININFDNISFYKDLLEFMGWTVIFEGENVVGYKSETAGDLWFLNASNQAATDYDAFGVNHIGLRVQSQADVDAVMEYLTKKGTEMLFDTPRHRSEFAASDKETYYQIMFESPDKILFEVVYIGELQSDD